MFSIKRDLPRRLHPSLSCLEDRFRDLLHREFDADSLMRLMQMEVENTFPSLGERDQMRIVDVVLEQMQGDGEWAKAVPGRCNVIPFPGRKPR